MCSGLLHGTLGFYKTISKTCVLPPSFFFFQHLNEKENQLNYVLAVLYKQCIVRRTYFHIFQFFKVFNVSVKNNFIKQILSS